MARINFHLDPGPKATLKRLIERGVQWRERQRARTLLLLDEGMLPEVVAETLGIHVRTVGTTRNQWMATGLTSLPDRPRSGAPRKLLAEHVERLLGWAKAEPLSASALLAKHKDSGGPDVHLATVHATLKNSGFVWKRTRSSLKKSRDEATFRQAGVKIEELREQAAAGEMVLAYVDEAGFAQPQPNRSAWTPRGERHLIEAKRGMRLNVLAALLSSGELFSATYWQTTTAETFGGFIGLLKEHVGKPLTVILDNASIHKAKSIRPAIEFLKKQGVNLYFLPPYSPELNRIERFWHKMKYTLLSVKSRTAQMLQEDVVKILDNFGTNYKFAF